MAAADGDFLARSASGPTNAFLQHCWVHTAAVAFVTNHMGWMPSILADLASPVDEDAGLLGDWDSLPPAPPRAAKRGRLTEEGAHVSQLASPARAARRTCVLGVQPPLLQHVALTVFLGELAQLPTGPLCGLALVAAQIRSPIYNLGLLCCEFKHGPTSAIIAPRLPFRCYQPDNAHTRAARSLRFFFNSGAGASCPLSRPLGGLGKAA